MEYSDLANFLNERMRERALAAKRLSELTGISVKHLEALRDGRIAEFPSPPYLRGYVLKLGQILEFDGDALWNELKHARQTNNSAPADELPENRFKKESPKPYIVFGGMALLLMLYFGFRFSKIFGRPGIIVFEPPENVTAVNKNSVSVAGRITDADALQVNSETVSAGQNGDWQKTVSLQPGMNTIEITAKKFLGGETKIIRQVVYEPAGNSTSSLPNP